MKAHTVKFLKIICAICLLPTLVMARKKITVQLKWQHQFQFAGFYAAQLKEFYKDAGLDVELKPGGPNISPVGEVLNGNADIGIFDPGVMTRSPKSNPLVILCPIMQSSPYGIISLKGKHILSPEDLIGKRVLAERDQGLSVFNAVLHKTGIDEKKIEFVPRERDSEEILNKNVDAVVTYITSQPQRLKALGVDVNIIRPEEYGVDFYGDLIFTTKKFAEQDPKVTDKFIKASLKGWEYALENPDELIRYIMKLKGETQPLSKALLYEEYKQVKSLIMPDMIEIGQSNHGRWLYILNFYKKMGVVSGDRELKEFLYKTHYQSLQDWIVPALFLLTIIAFITLGIAALNWKLRQQVRKQTLALQKEVESRKAAESKARQNEEKLQLAISNANIGIWELDLDTEESYVSDNWYYLLGYNVDFFPVNLSILNLLHPDDLEKIHHIIKEGIAEGLTNIQQCKLLKRDGTTLHTLISLKKIRNDFQSDKYFGVLINIDELKRKEDELLNLSEKLIQRNNELKKFAYITSHNLRGPVVNITSLTEMVDKQSLPEEDQVIFEKLEFSVNRLKETLNDLIEVVSYQETNEQHAEILKFDDVLMDMARTIEQQLIEIDPVISKDFKVEEVFYPKIFLESIFLNLLTNALKYRHPKRQLKISFSTQLNESGDVELAVADNGIGIDMKKNGHKLFGLYQRFESHIDGKGLGLFIVKSHIDSQKGSIKVESEVDKGTTFRIVFV